MGDILTSSLTAARFQFTLAAEAAMHLPPFLGSTLRGGFGAAFRQTSCANPGLPGCSGCLLKQVCAYSYCFATTLPPDSEVLRSQGEIPRPFVIEPAADERAEIPPGGELRFGLVLIGRAIGYFPYFLLSFQRLGEMGIGRGRNLGLGRFKISAVHSLAPWSDHPAAPVYDSSSGRITAGGIRIITAADVSARLKSCFGPEGESRCVAVNYSTMTRLKSGEALARQPEFHILLRALLRRISALAYFHGGGRIEADYAGLAHRARLVGLVRDGTRWHDWTRYSSRQDARMELGGLVGEALYEGMREEFLPWLLWGEIVHAGKNATFGLGRIRVEKSRE